MTPPWECSVFGALLKKKIKKFFNPQFAEAEEDIKSRSKVFSHLSATLLAVFFVFAVSQFEFNGLKGVLIDALIRSHWKTFPHPDVILIAYDDDSSVRYGGSTKIPAEELAQVFDSLAEEKPL